MTNPRITGDLLAQHALAAPLALLLASLVTMQANAQWRVDLPRQYPVIGGADAMIVADLDANGHTDVLPLVANAPRYEIQPDGELVQVALFTGINLSRGGAAADFNNDGLLDIVYGGYASSGSVNIALATAPGVFATPLATPAGLWPTTVIASDITGDGLADVVARNDSGIILFRNLGQGVLDAGQVILAGSHIGLAAADMDQDGDQDIVTVSFGGNSFIRILVNAGAGTFSSLPDISTATQARDLAIADLNNDGRLDIVTVARSNMLAAVHLGTGPTLTFVQSTFDVPGNPLAMALVDANRDGTIDVVLSSEDSNARLVLLLNNGAGQLAAQAVAGTSPNIKDIAAGVPVAGGSPVIIAAGILGVSVHPTTDSGQLVGSTYVTSRTLTTSGDIADMNGDGLADIVGLSRTRISVVFRQPSGSYAPPVTYNLPLASSYGTVLARDLNDDALPDVIVFHDDMSSVLVALNGGSGTLLPFSTYAGIGGIPKVQEIDLNGDGRLDFVASGGNFGVTTYLLNPGDGTLISSPGPRGPTYGEMVHSDANRDGLLDLVSCSPHNDPTNNTRVLIARPDGTYEPARFATVPDLAQYLTAADFDGDGQDEYAVRGDIGVYVLKSDGQGTLTVIGSYPLNSTGYSIASADLDADGVHDLIALNQTIVSGRYGVQLLRNRGDGRFEPPITLISTYDARSFAVGDVNADAKPDLMIASRVSASTNNFSILHGPFFPCRADVNCDDMVDFFDYADFVQIFANGTSAADFNGDGVVDFFDYLDFVATFARGC